jgi:hypothetical protein
MSDTTQDAAFDLRQYLGSTIAAGQRISIRGSFGEVAKGTVLAVSASSLFVKGTADVAIPPYRGPFSFELATRDNGTARVKVTYEVKGDKPGDPPKTKTVVDDKAPYGPVSYWVELKPVFDGISALLQLARSKEATDIWVMGIKYWMVPASLVQHLPEAAAAMLEPPPAAADAGASA